MKKIIIIIACLFLSGCYVVPVEPTPVIYEYAPAPRLYYVPSPIYIRPSFHYENHRH
jgi:hypothetical protein